MKPTIVLRYTCKRCDLKDAEMQVPARGDAQDVVEWLQASMLLLQDEHDARRPRCPTQALDVKIPTTGGDRIGAALMN